MKMVAVQGLETLNKLSFPDSVEQAVQRVQSNLFDLVNYLDQTDYVGFPQLSERLHQEIQQYFTTGNCGGSETRKVCPNPTFLEPITGKWHVHYAACPFDGFLPIPLKELNKKAHGNQLLNYCQVELKKLLVAFRKRSRDVKFFFYPGDALAFCYQDSPLKFDVIAASHLGDVVGLVNVLNAAGRKLRSAQSVLVTETAQWINVASNVSQYVQKVLCCPLSLIPTIYGLHLMDDIERGSTIPPNPQTYAVTPTRIRWKTALPFDGVPLVLSPTLEHALKQLRDECFHLSPSSILLTSTAPGRCGMVCYSPLTFRYVLDDMIRGGGFRDPVTVMSSACSRLPPVFTKSLETSQAWLENRPVWRVKVCVPQHDLSEDEAIFKKNFCFGLPVLRLILIPAADVPSLLSNPQDWERHEKEFNKWTSDKYHFFDNLDVNMKKKSDGDEMEISFLLHDRSLLESHCGIIVGVVESSFLPIVIPWLSKTRHALESFNTPFPCHWKNPKPAESSHCKSRWLVGESCRESEGDFVMRFKVRQQSSANEKPPSGIS